MWPRFLKPGLASGNNGAVVALRLTAAAAARGWDEDGCVRGLHLVNPPLQAHNWPGLLHTLQLSQVTQNAIIICGHTKQTQGELKTIFINYNDII